MKCRLKNVEIRTNSAIVLSWIGSVITGNKKVWTKDAVKMIIQQQLGILNELITKLGLNLHATLVPLEKN